MKAYRSIILLAVVALFLGGFYFFIKSGDDPSKTGMLYDYGAKETIQEITITNPHGTFAFYRKDDKWVVETEERYRTNPEKMEMLTENLLRLPILRVMEKDSEEYGFSAPQAVVSFSTTGGDENKFLVGNTAASGLDVYIKNEKTGEVVIGSTSAVSQLGGSLAAYRDKEVFFINKAQMKEISYYEGETLVVTAQNETTANWFLTYPYEAPARKIELNELLVTMGAWKIAGYPKGLSEKEMGLETPAFALEVTDGAGTTQRLEFGTGDGTTIYVRTGAQQEVVQLYAVDVDFSHLNPDDLVFVAPLKTPLEEIAFLTIESGGVKTDFEVTEEQIKANGKKIDFNDFSSIFYKYIGMNAHGYDPKEISLQAPVATFKTVLKDGQKKELGLHQRDAETLYMEIDGKTEFYLDKEKLEELLARIENSMA